MEIDEKEVTSSSVPDGEYKSASSIEEIGINDTSEEIESAQRTFTLRISKDVKGGSRFEIDIEREEEKEFFSTINQELKKIK